MLASRIVCGWSASVQSCAAGVVYVLCRISWLSKPAGNGDVSTSLIAYDAVVLPSLVRCHVVSSIAPLTTSEFWTDGFCSDGFCTDGFWTEGFWTDGLMIP